MYDAGGVMWWVKLPNNPQAPMVLINERIVVGCGALIGAPTYEAAIVGVTDAIAGDVRGVRVEAGLAHGTRDIGAALNEQALLHRARDDNARRHVGAYAIHDWCRGDDSPWLYAPDEDHKTYSHGHGGLWLLPERASLERRLGSGRRSSGCPGAPQEPFAGLEAVECATCRCGQRQRYRHRCRASLPGGP